MSHAMDISRITKDIFKKYPKELKMTLRMVRKEC